MNSAIGEIMHTSMFTKILAIAALFSISAPNVFAQYPQYDYNNNQYNNRKVVKHYNHPHQNQYNHRKYKVKKVHRDNRSPRAVVYRDNSNGNNGWNWNQHNWNEQRDQLRSNWRQRRTRMNAAQQQQLDTQMQAQWRQYHNNNWTGANNWDQYSDPRFLDYLHTNNPNFLTTVRSSLGF